jgi:hypothetical protein
VAKDKKKKKKDKKDKAGAGVGAAKAATSLKAIAQNPLVADIVAAALVSTAAALKDSKKARLLAAQAGDELEKLAREGSEKGSAMWQLALDIGRRSLESLSSEIAPKRARPNVSKVAPKRAKARARGVKSPGK